MDFEGAGDPADFADGKAASAGKAAPKRGITDAGLVRESLNVPVPDDECVGDTLADFCVCGVCGAARWSSHGITVGDRLVNRKYRADTNQVSEYLKNEYTKYALQVTVHIAGVIRVKLGLPAWIQANMVGA